nr:MAG TPA: hypothetical protein [Bacteriophage sp.]
MISFSSSVHFSIHCAFSDCRGFASRKFRKVCK